MIESLVDKSDVTSEIIDVSIPQYDQFFKIDIGLYDNTGSGIWSHWKTAQFSEDSDRNLEDYIEDQIPFWKFQDPYFRSWCS